MLKNLLAIAFVSMTTDYKSLAEFVIKSVAEKLFS